MTGTKPKHHVAWKIVAGATVAVVAVQAVLMVIGGIWLRRDWGHVSEPRRGNHGTV